MPLMAVVLPCLVHFLHLREGGMNELALFAGAGGGILGGKLTLGIGKRFKLA